MKTLFSFVFSSLLILSSAAFGNTDSSTSDSEIVIDDALVKEAYVKVLPSLVETINKDLPQTFPDNITLSKVRMPEEDRIQFVWQIPYPNIPDLSTFSCDNPMIYELLQRGIKVDMVFNIENPKETITRPLEITLCTSTPTLATHVDGTLDKVAFKKWIEEYNRQLPLQLDENMTMLSISLDDDTVVMQAAINVDAQYLPERYKTQLKTAVASFLCQNQMLYHSFQNGIKLRYEFLNESGNTLIVLPISLQDCPIQQQP